MLYYDIVCFIILYYVIVLYYVTVLCYDIVLFDVVFSAGRLSCGYGQSPY